MTNVEKALDKIKKLIALKESPNENEAALAATRIQEILDKYNLSMSDLPDEEQDKVTSMIAGDVIARGTRSTISRYVSSLFSGLANQFDCMAFLSRTYIDGSRKQIMCIIGHKQDIEVVLYTYDYLFNSILGLYRKDLKKYGKEFEERTGQKLPKSRRGKFREAYMLGAVDRILITIKKERDARLKKDENCTSLVLARKEKVESWARENVSLKNARPSRKRFDAEAYQKGYDGAKDIRIRQGINSKNSDSIGD